MTTAAALEADLHRLIPLSAAMAVRVRCLTTETLALEAPLSSNHNHAGTAFAGSLYALASLAGWALLRETFHRAGLSPQLVLGHGEMRYRRPVSTDLSVLAHLPAAEQAPLVDRLRRGRRVRCRLEIADPDSEATIFVGRFHAMPRTL